MYISHKMKLSFYNKNLTTTSFKKIKFYNLIIKVLLNQNLVTTSSFQYILLNFNSNLTLLKKNFSSKYSQSFIGSIPTTTFFPKTGLLPLSSSPQMFLKSKPLIGTETLKLFQLFLKLSHNKPFSHSTQHHIYRLLFSNVNHNELVYSDLGKAFSRWSSTHSLLINLFYYNIKIISFGSKLLINETLALN